jgi:hypothetical protein
LQELADSTAACERNLWRISRSRRSRRRLLHNRTLSQGAISNMQLSGPALRSRDALLARRGAHARHTCLGQPTAEQGRKRGNHLDAPAYPLYQMRTATGSHPVRCCGIEESGTAVLRSQRTVSPSASADGSQQCEKQSSGNQVSPGLPYSNTTELAGIMNQRHAGHPPRRSAS